MALFCRKLVSLTENKKKTNNGEWEIGRVLPMALACSAPPTGLWGAKRGGKLLKI